MKDRMQDLRAAAKKENRNSFEMDADCGETTSFLQPFFEQVQEIEGDIAAIALNVDEVKKKHTYLLSAPTMDEPVKDQRLMETFMNNIRRKGASVKAKLKLMNESNQRLKAEDDKPTQLRIRETQYFALQKRFVDLISEFSKRQTDYKDNYMEKLRRQMQIMGKETSELELEQMLESGNVRVFTQDILMNTEKEKRMLADIESRHSQIIDLEKSIKELHDLFLDMAIIVEEQGELVDRIEANVGLAGHDVESGGKELGSAIKYKDKALRKKIICGLILLTILFIIIVVLVLQLT